MIARIAKIVTGALAYRFTGRTSDSAYQSLIRLFCKTQGRSNDILHAIVKQARPTQILPNPSGILGEVTDPQAEEVADHIRERGFYIFPKKVPTALCEDLMKFALHKEATPTPRLPNMPEKVRFDPQFPVAHGYRFIEQDLIENPTVQQIASDQSLLTIAQKYLNCLPVMSILAMWWSTAVAGDEEVRRQLAQMFHFDMDRIKWLKFFIHLTDIGPDNGPHCYVARSNRTGNQPRELLRRGYTRISDEDINKYYPADAVEEITGPRGTIFAADTRGFHKGKAIQSGDRLIFQIEFSDCLFGGIYHRLDRPSCMATQFTEMLGKYPDIYSRFAA